MWNLLLVGQLMKNSDWFAAALYPGVVPVPILLNMNFSMIRTLTVHSRAESMQIWHFGVSDTRTSL